MRILITGGAGFIGSYLAERCLNDGFTVSVLDDLSTGLFTNIAHLKDIKRFSFVLGTIFDHDQLEALVRDCDFIYHMAAAVGVRLILEDPVRSLSTNLLGSEAVLKSAAKHHKRIVLASTSEVYGKSTDVPFREDADLVLGHPGKVRWSYACSKAVEEYLGLAYWRETALPVTIVRFFNVIGPRQTSQYGAVLPEFLEQAISGQPLTVFGTGEQRRCFGYVGDVVEALIRTMRRDSTVGEILNIGSDREISIKDLASLVKRITESASDIVFVPYEAAYGSGFEETWRRIPATGKMQALLDFECQTSLETVIEMMTRNMRRPAQTQPARNLSQSYTAR